MSIKLAQNFAKFLAIIFIELSLPAHALSPGCPAEMISYWTYDDGTARDVVGSNHAALFGAIPDPNGIIGGALRFNGLDSYALVNAFSEILVDNFSVELWLKSLGDQGGQPYDSFLLFGECCNSHTWNFAYNYPNASFDLWDIDSPSWFIPSDIRNRWAHVVISYTNNTKFLYVDGVLLDQRAVALPLVYQGSNALYFGYTPGGEDQRLDGLLDEVAIYRRALTADEISRHYQRGLTGKGYCEQGIPFAVFTPRVRVQLGPAPHDDSFTISANFRVGADSDGIDPVSQNIMVTFGSFSTTIPAGKFERRGALFTFRGAINAVNLQAQIYALPRPFRMVAHGFKPTTYGFKLQASGAELGNTTVSPSVQLAIGDDTGQATLNVGNAWFAKDKDGEQ